MITLFAQAKQNPQTLGDYYRTPLLLFSITNFVLVILFATFMTFKTKEIVKFVCRPSDYDENSSLFADRIVIYEMALVIMGLLIIIWTLPDFAFKLKNHIKNVQNNIPNRNYDTNFIITSGIKIFFGLIATIYAKSISRMLVKGQKN